MQIFATLTTNLMVDGMDRGYTDGMDHGYTDGMDCGYIDGPSYQLFTTSLMPIQWASLTWVRGPL